MTYIKIMKKIFLFSLGVLVTFSLLFVSCDENEYDPTICTVTVKSDGNGKAGITNYVGTFAKIVKGNNVEVVATPNDGCIFAGWFFENVDTPVSLDERYMFIASENITLTARFIKLSNLTLCSTTYGSVSLVGYTDFSIAVMPGTEVTVVATPDEGCDFIGWFIGDSEEPVSTDVEYTLTMTVDIYLTAKFVPIPINGYEWVDLGLPSGLKWAAYNVGATKPEEYGGYYAWGETEEKENYDWNTYKWWKGRYDIYITVTKYCYDAKDGNVDKKDVLDPEDDVANVKWGGIWRMPTYSEQDELRKKCTWQWTTQNGVNGYKVTSKKNGNSIFLPAAGYRDGVDVYDAGTCGNFWSSSLFTPEAAYAYFLSFDAERYSWNGYRRSCGYSVRPVYELGEK